MVPSTDVLVLWLNQLNILLEHILGDPGTDSGGEGKSKRAEKYGTKRSKERRCHLQEVSGKSRLKVNGKLQATSRVEDSGNI